MSSKSEIDINELNKRVLYLEEKVEALLRESDTQFKAISGGASPLISPSMKMSSIPSLPSLKSPKSNSASAPMSVPSPQRKTFNQLVDIYRKKGHSPVEVPAVNIVRGHLELLPVPGARREEGEKEELKEIEAKRDNTPYSYSLFGGNSFSSMSLNSFPPPPSVVSATAKDNDSAHPPPMSAPNMVSTNACAEQVPPKIVYSNTQLLSIKDRARSSIADHSGSGRNGTRFTPAISKSSTTNTAGDDDSGSGSDGHANTDPGAGISDKDTARSANSPSNASPQESPAANPSYTREIKRGFTIDMPIA